MFDWIADTVFGRSQRRLYKELQEARPLFWNTFAPYSVVSYRVETLNSNRDRQAGWRGCVLVITENGVTIYPHSQKMDQSFTFPKEALRWFGRPRKYEPGKNDVWLHFEVNHQWQQLQLRTEHYQMQKIIRALKQVATEAQIKAYRRHRPYIHYGPMQAFAATQDLYGVWTVEGMSHDIYLMPYALILLDSDQVRQVIPLEKVQQIEALRRMDAPTLDGVVRFRIEGETERLAYSLSDYAAFGAALAEAAKRTLEDPVMVKKKDKDYYDEEEGEDD